MNENFYREIPAFHTANGISDARNYRDVPADWYVAITDVKNSTTAITEGRYKDVNVVGASVIMATLNAVRDVELPYVFGGDGATILVPASKLEAVQKALLGTRQMALREYKLDLHIGCVPVSEILASGYAVRAGRHAISNAISLAVFTGGGLAFAEKLVKDQTRGEKFRLSAPAQVDDADFRGLECRWQPIDASKGEIISVLIQVTGGDSPQQLKIYEELIEEIEVIVGAGANPAKDRTLKVNLNPLSFRAEQKVRSTGQNVFRRGVYLLKTWLATLIGFFLFAFRITGPQTDWGKYKDDVVKNADYWKYDDMLRFVMDVTPAQKRALLNCFEGRSARGEIVYGVHSSKEALMTCLVFNRDEKHVHFLDGGDGGYAMASKQMKDKLKVLPEQRAG